VAAQYGERLRFSTDEPVHVCRHFGRAKQILLRTIDDLRSENHGYYKVLSSFYELLDLATFENRPRTPIQTVRELIDESYTVSDLNVERLCRDAGFSHAQMLRLFKREYGKTIQRYIIEKRLSLACELLANSDISVRSVAFSCGFSDEIHFMKTFKNHYGLTATEYRKNC
jgi:transcriptional regulator GlxA family with amidase domain